MSKTSGAVGGGLTFLEVLFLIFLVLKLTGKTVVATWSWWWVTAPLWGGLAIVLVIFLIGLLFIGLSMLLNK
jgi:hypothetical protein